MSFFAILFALMLEQAYPLHANHPAHQGLRAWAVSVRRGLDAGSNAAHPWLALAAAVLVPVACVSAVYWLLYVSIGWPLALLWNVAVLYVTLGFRQFSHHFTRIRDALDDDDLPAARAALARWLATPVQNWSQQQVLTTLARYAVVQAHRHVFGVFFWFTVCMLLGLGPAGAVLYRTTEYLVRQWNERVDPAAPLVSEPLQRCTRTAWQWLDWLPARCTALGFAVVGSFEDAIAAWRSYAERVPGDSDGIIIAATAGALHMDLGEPETADGLAPQFQHLYSLVGLVWRWVAVWLLLLALLTLGRLLG